MKKNNKGFMMVELVVVSCVVIISVVSLYTGFNRVYKSYNERSKYYSVDCLYALEVIKNLFIDEYKLYDIVTDSELSYKNVIDYCNSDDAFSKYCNEVYDRYNIDSIYLIKYNDDNLNKFYNNISDVAYIRYLDFFSKQEDGNTLNIYMIAKDKDDYFANILVVNSDEI